MAKPTSAQVHSVITYFIKQRSELYDGSQRVNRNAAKWGIEGMLMDMSVDEVKSLIDFYFTTGSKTDHDLAWFLYNYEKLAESKDAVEEDRERRAKMRKESEERARRWRERGNEGVANS